jgi:hypothetical protein
MRRFVRVLLALAAVGCSRPDRSGLRPVQPASVTLDQFQALRVLQGTWRGSEAGGTPFYESYVFLDDSTIRSFGYPDSTFAQAKDSSTVALAGGQVTSVGGSAVWVATRFDSNIIRFEPRRGATNSFTWTIHSRDAWTALLEWSEQDGKPRSLVYQMQRLGP